MITENHTIIQTILNSKNVNNETKLLALNEILNLNARHKKAPLKNVNFFTEAFDLYNADDIDELFEWEDSELGVKFWAKIQDKVFEPEKRTC